ncbi:uncharacterized protein I303_107764 [Kwoniella dejecticola CBS 10117]|uniref:Ribosomal protein L9 domain-containing protein n=1 Tax=Kwoniella dejecticola CBS 10117 TaxID=1296121 RepID=A0A1A5ZVM6_9TREE|nr:uncharacterized protein I303_07769 [Kwoniella dejecticola CBS 10117]OBR81859.1 hypothetical protein I303_07769 [Kwoniella dejecticola CBS 10117]
MYASSSRVVLQSSLGAARLFSSSIPSAARRETFIELLQDVPGLGRTFDRLFVAPGRARNDLVPTRQARFVPFKNNGQRQIYRATDADRSTASLLIEEQTSSTGLQSSSSSSSTTSETPQELLNALHLLPNILTFKRRTISPDYPTLHGSLTLSDIQNRLDSQHGLPSSEIELNWVNREAGSRIKELVSTPLKVSFKRGGQEETEVVVEVVRLQEGETEDQ